MEDQSEELRVGDRPERVEQFQLDAAFPDRVNVKTAPVVADENNQ